jgi:hypothetical protein
VEKGEKQHYDSEKKPRDFFILRFSAEDNVQALDMELPKQ